MDFFCIILKFSVNNNFMKGIEFISENDRSVTPNEIFKKGVENDWEKRGKHQ